MSFNFPFSNPNTLLFPTNVQITKKIVNDL